ncbi:MAG: hypothetical protein IT243_01710 [Bacteroidia bacterium]|nr:hypothetical protein [Bacteroidia bacterium]
MTTIINKWILVVVLVLTTIIFAYADNKPKKTKQIETKDTLVFEKLHDDTLTFDDRIYDDTLIFAEDEITYPNSDKIYYNNNKSKSDEIINNEIKFSVSQHYFSNNIIIKTNDNDEKIYDIYIVSSEGKMVLSSIFQKEITLNDYLKSGIFYIYLKNGLLSSFKKILIK